MDNSKFIFANYKTKKDKYGGISILALLVIYYFLVVMSLNYGLNISWVRYLDFDGDLATGATRWVNASFVYRDKIVDFYILNYYYSWLVFIISLLFFDKDTLLILSKRITRSELFLMSVALIFIFIHLFISFGESEAVFSRNDMGHLEGRALNNYYLSISYVFAATICCFYSARVLIVAFFKCFWSK